MIDGLDRLRHDAVVGGHHQHHDIGDVGTARTHLGKGRVARRVEKRDFLLVLGGDLVGTDMLGDAARLAARDIGLAQGIEQAGLAVIDMAHDGNHRRTRPERFFRVLIGGRLNVDIAFGNTLDIVAEFLDQQFRGILVDRLVDGDHHAHVEQRLDQFGTLFGHAVGEFLDGDCLGHDHVAHLLFARAIITAATMRAAFLFARTLERGQTARTAPLVFVQRTIDGQLATAPLVVGTTFGTNGALVFLLLFGTFDFGPGDRRELARSGRRLSRT